MRPSHIAPLIWVNGIRLYVKEEHRATLGPPFYDTRVASHRDCASSEQTLQTDWIVGPMAIRLVDFWCVSRRFRYADFAIGWWIARDNSDWGKI